MGKIKISLWVCFLLCCFSVGVFGSSETDSDSDSDQFKTPVPVADSDPNPIELLEGLVKYFKVNERKNREQEKINQELKDEFKLLREEINQLKNRIGQDHGIWFLTPPIRESRGKPREKQDSEISAGLINFILNLFHIFSF